MMEFNLIDYYGFLTREEYETHCFEISTELYISEVVSGGESIQRQRLVVRNFGTRKRYPKTFSEAKRELAQRGLDPGDDTYGLVRVVESGEVAPAGNMWKKSDIELAMISLVELYCIEPWVYTCKSFNIRPVEYVKALRTAAEENLEQLGLHAAEPLLYRYEFRFGDSYSEPGTLSITLRDDWQKLARQFHEGFVDAAEEG